MKGQWCHGLAQIGRLAGPNKSRITARVHTPGRGAGQGSRTGRQDLKAVTASLECAQNGLQSGDSLASVSATIVHQHDRPVARPTHGAAGDSAGSGASPVIGIKTPNDRAHTQRLADSANAIVECAIRGSFTHGLANALPTDRTVGASELR